MRPSYPVLPSGPGLPFGAQPSPVALEQVLSPGMTLAQLWAIVRATDLAFGCNWEFSRRRVGSFQAGYLREPGVVRVETLDAETRAAHAPARTGPVVIGG